MISVCFQGKSFNITVIQVYAPNNDVKEAEVDQVYEDLKDLFRESNGTPLQCSCLENPRDGGASWAAICGVAQSRTQLK